MSRSLVTFTNWRRGEQRPVSYSEYVVRPYTFCCCESALNKLSLVRPSRSDTGTSGGRFCSTVLLMADHATYTLCGESDSLVVDLVVFA